MKNVLASIIVIATWTAGNALAQSRPPSPGAPAIKATPFHLLHLPYNTAVAGRPLELVAVVNGPWTGDELVVRFRHVGSSSEYQEAPFERAPSGTLYATIPGPAMQVPGVEYYIVGRSQSDEWVQHFASVQTPHRVAVALSTEEAWTRVQTRRLQGYMSNMRALVEFLDFHNAPGSTDSHVRAEIEWTHHFLTVLHAVSVGYGLFDGHADDSDEGDNPGYRYGYGSLQLRLHPKFWIHGRAMLGVDNQGFTAGGRVVVTLGKPWRASVDLGGEMIDALGSSAWLRLQWDTVPRVLMGTTVMKTSLTDAEGKLTGSVLTYDLAWQASAHVSVLARLSLAARKGSANIGGALGAAWAF